MSIAIYIYCYSYIYAFIYQTMYSISIFDYVWFTVKIKFFILLITFYS